MLGIERRQKIIDKLQHERKVYVADLSNALQVTQETVRRDLEKLENDGLLRRSYGGAVLANPTNEDLSFANRTAVNYDLKQNIAQKAAALVANGSTVMADSSSTVLSLVDALQGKKEITIVTNSIKLMSDYASAGFSMVASGGDLRPNSLCLVGTEACRALTRYNVDLAIVSCKGLDRNHGITESNEPESTIKQYMARQAKTRMLLADHTKFDQVVFAKSLDWSEVDYLITDSEPKRQWIDFCRRNNVQLVY